jgi:hypothetical protein
MSAKPRVPTDQCHKQSGQAVVTLTDAISGRRRDVLLGKYGTKASKEEYKRIVLQWEVGERRMPGACQGNLSPCVRHSPLPLALLSARRQNGLHCACEFYTRTLLPPTDFESARSIRYGPCIGLHCACEFYTHTRRYRPPVLWTGRRPKWIALCL